MLQYMFRRIAFLAAIALCGCGQQQSNSAAPPGRSDIAAPRLPFENSTGFLDGYRVEVPRQGDITWSGMPVSKTTLTGYLGDLASRPQGSRLFVEFEPGVSPAQADWVRRQIIDSGLCAQRRCAEVGWHLKRPVVN
ncbi:hypothetical protein BH10PSE14_BH10PSE14_27040 [soil metagenome]